jgi:hypothetical protein
MVERGTFGRRGARERHDRVYRVEASEPTQVAPKPKPTTKELIIGFVGIAMCISVLVHSGKGDDPVASTQPAATQAVKTPKPVPPCTATMTEYLALGTGTTLSQATSIIGCKGREFSRVTIGKTDDVTMQWQGNGGIFSNMVASFDNDRLTSKAQLGLE